MAVGWVPDRVAEYQFLRIHYVPSSIHCNFHCFNLKNPKYRSIPTTCKINLQLTTYKHFFFFTPFPTSKDKCLQDSKLKNPRLVLNPVHFCIIRCQNKNLSVFTSKSYCSRCLQSKTLKEGLRINDQQGI